MKKISVAIILSVLIFSVVFSACNGADSGKVSDTHRSDPMLTKLEDMVTEAMTDIRDMMTDDVTDGFNDISTNVTR
jgi:peptidoglycan hydrolase CwlO-like protein